MATLTTARATAVATTAILFLACAPGGYVFAEEEDAAAAAEVKVTLGVPLLAEAEAAFSQLQASIECSDADEGCPDWAATGECDKNRGYMSQNCRVSCGLCESMEPRTFLGHLESGLMALRALDVSLRNLPEKENAEEAHKKVKEALAAVLARISTDQQLPKPTLYLSRIVDMLAQVFESLPETTKSANTPLEVVVTEGRNVVPKGTLNDALFGLENGVVMPLVGFGTWQLLGDACYQATLAALREGYRHIDTAQGYHNEREVGKAIKDSGLKRGEIFLSTKLSSYEDFEEGKVAMALEKQLRDLGTTYVDLYMIHGPHPNAPLNLVAWKQMESLLKQGFARAIGVSNFDVYALESLIDHGTVKPMYVQNKLSIYHSGGQYAGENHLEFCKRHNIALMSYSTLNAWPHQISPLKDAIVKSIGDKHHKTSAQVLLRWALQMGAGIIPRSANATRIGENLNLFDFSLDAADMLLLNSLQDLIASPRNKRFLGPSLFEDIIATPAPVDIDPFFNPEEQSTPEGSVDPAQLSAAFVNSMSGEVKLLWLSHDGSKVDVGAIKSEDEVTLSTYHGHSFEAQFNGRAVKQFTMDRTKGAQQKFVISDDKEQQEDEL